MESQQYYFNSLNKKNVLVVGGNGFIGHNLIKKLELYGASIVNLSLQKKYRELTGKTTCLYVDVRDKNKLKRAINGFSFEYVFNLGGYIDHAPYLKGGREVIDVHYGGLLNLINTVLTGHLKGFVQVGSSDEYGKSEAPQKECYRELPFSPYSAAKVAATQLIQALASTEQFPGTVVRLFLVYGPGQNRKRFLPQVIKGCMECRTFPVSEGMQLRDFCYIEDAVEGILSAALENRANGKVLNIASGDAVSIRDVIEKVVKLIGSGFPEFGAHHYRSGENMAVFADVTQAQKVLNWRPFTSLDKGLVKTIEWYRRQFKV